MKQLARVRGELGSNRKGPLGLNEYQTLATRTYRGGMEGSEKMNFLLLGLSGEVGSVLSELKKKQRDSHSYTAYARSAVEETGDVLWYLANVADQAGIPLFQLAEQTHASVGLDPNTFTFADLEPQAALFEEPASNAHVQHSLLTLAARTGRAVQRAHENEETTPLRDELRGVFDALVAAASQAHVSLERAATLNLVKLINRWPIKRTWGNLYDSAYGPEEQLPRHLEITFRERQISGKSYVFQSVHGVHVGDRLTDNSADEDDYRFHDVFHLSFASILGWSPVLRALLKVKRKSDPQVDEHQDGARAIITEEGISNWIFAHGLRLNAFAQVDSLDFALLKTVRDMVKGYEVESRPLWMWEHAILRGFEVFRELKRYRGGTVTVDLKERKISFTPPSQ